MTLIYCSQFCSSWLGADLWVFNFSEQFGSFVVIFAASLQCSVLVHSGGVHGGHYYAFIRPKLSDQWYIQFNIWIELSSTFSLIFESNCSFLIFIKQRSFSGTRSHSCFNSIWKGNGTFSLIFESDCSYFNT